MKLRQEYNQFLNDYFNRMTISRPLFYGWKYGLRFDLQIEATSVEEYFQEVNHRANALFNAVFEPNDSLYLVMHEFKYRKRKIRFDNFVFRQIANLDISEIAFEIKKYVYYEDDIYNYSIIKLTTERLNIKKIISAIANSDFGDRTPQLHKKFTPFSSRKVFFINIDKKLVFNMYDDRGLDIISSDLETIRPIYENYNNWILDYDRKKIDEVFKID